MSTKVTNSSDKAIEIIIVSREIVRLDPGEEIEFNGDIELGPTK
jgi:hypothetical protein